MISVRMKHTLVLQFFGRTRWDFFLKQDKTHLSYKTYSAPNILTSWAMQGKEFHCAVMYEWQDKGHFFYLCTVIFFFTNDFQLPIAYYFYLLSALNKKPSHLNPPCVAEVETSCNCALSCAFTASTMKEPFTSAVLYHLLISPSGSPCRKRLCHTKGGKGRSTMVQFSPLQIHDNPRWVWYFSAALSPGWAFHVGLYLSPEDFPLIMCTTIQMLLNQSAKLCHVLV